jgi:membrane-bound inhibitor of C-type lysozyme
MDTLLRKIACCLAPALLPTGAWAEEPLKTVNYDCAYGRSLVVQYFGTPVLSLPNGMPMPGGHVVVTQADGTRHVLQEMPAETGTRYANERDTFVFWVRPDGAFAEEGPSQTVSYSNCVAQR